jgi:hypothetical protein
MSELASKPHCPTCICGRRAPVMGSGSLGCPGFHGIFGPGSITWTEHFLAWSAYASRYGAGQSAERLAEQGGFSYEELVSYLGHPPTTWEPR